MSVATVFESTAKGERQVIKDKPKQEKFALVAIEGKEGTPLLRRVYARLNRRGDFEWAYCGWYNPGEKMSEISLGKQVEAMVENLRAQPMFRGVDGECVLNGIAYKTEARKLVERGEEVIRIEITEIPREAR